MLMPKKNRVAIYENLFKEGVMVAEKDFHAPKHPELETIPNLQVRDSLQLWVLGGMEILLSHHHALLEEVLVDSNAVLLRHQHPEVLTSLVEVNQAILAWSF